MTNLKEFIYKLTTTIEPAEKAKNLACWNLNTTGEEKFAQELKDAQIALRKIYSSPSDYQFIKKHPLEKDPLLNRQAILALNEYTENQIPSELIDTVVQLETEIDTVYTNFRPVINGQKMSNNDLKMILTESNNSSERQQAWEASKKIGEQVKEKVLELISLRNQCAKKVGFNDFYSMRLQLQELDQERLFALLQQLDQVTTPYWQQYKPRLDQTLAKRFGISPLDIKPWHYADPFFQEAPREEFDLDPFYKNKPIEEISRKFFEAIGLPVDDILKRSDLYDRDKKNQHAFCLCIDRKQDVRILCNLRDNAYWMGTQLHELGHAVYDKYIDQSLPYLLRTPAHVSSTEAIAMLFGRLNQNADFLQHYCAIDAKTAQNAAKKGRQQVATGLLVFARWILVMTHFERAMYQQPNINLNAYWWDCVEKFQGVKRVPNRDLPDWAAKVHLACAPVYYQNYIIGEMTASQLEHKLKSILNDKHENYVTSPNVGKWLKDSFIGYGARFHWEETLKKATGEPLNPLYFAKDIEGVLQ